MPCDHLGPAEIIELAEKDLRGRGLPAEKWSSVRYRHGENTPDGMWASVVIEIERRGDQWVVVRLDRNRETLTENELGLSVV